MTYRSGAAILSFLCGVFCLIVGQSALWTTSVKTTLLNVMSSGKPLETHQAPFRANFAIKATRVEPWGTGSSHERLCTINLVNHSQTKLKILFAETGCCREGCRETIDLPKQVNGGEEFVIQVKAKWSGTPEKPLPIRVFTDQSLTEVLELELLPDSAKIVDRSAKHQDSHTSQIGLANQ